LHSAQLHFFKPCSVVEQHDLPSQHPLLALAVLQLDPEGQGHSFPVTQQQSSPAGFTHVQVEQWHFFSLDF
jgi:hypothetical protein